MTPMPTIATALVQFSPNILLTIAALVITITVIDIFFPIEAISVSALLGLAVYISLMLDVTWPWRVLIIVISWLFSCAIFFIVWRKIAGPITERLMGSKVTSGLDGAVGTNATFKTINGKHFCYWNGEIYPVSTPIGEQSFENGDTVRVQSVSDGVFTISRINTI
jgi:hypothetical protein